MKYAKPEVVVVATAANAIQSHTSKDGSNFELNTKLTQPPAYEADE